MPFYEDLSDCTDLLRRPEGSVNIGWLDLNQSFNQGFVEPAIILRIGELCRNPVNRTRGWHKCPKCQEYPIREVIGADEKLLVLGDAEIHIFGKDKVYVCPTLTYHYILKHGYAPPEEFLDAVASRLQKSLNA